MRSDSKPFRFSRTSTNDQLAELAPFFATDTFQPGRDIVRQNDPGRQVLHHRARQSRSMENRGTVRQYEARRRVAGRRFLRRDHSDYGFSANRDGAHRDVLHLYFAGRAASSTGCWIASRTCAGACRKWPCSASGNRAKSAQLALAPSCMEPLPLSGLRFGRRKRILIRAGSIDGGHFATHRANVG